jgi:secondary thiamine-phosphate synthase enzyme
MKTRLIQVHTGDTATAVDLTHELVDFCDGEADGLVSVFVPHATAGIAIFETGAGSERDTLAAVDDLLPRDPGRWRHEHGSPGHGRDHVLPAFIAPSVTIPVIGGVPQLGTWQSVVLIDTNIDNAVRSVRLSFVPA